MSQSYVKKRHKSSMRWLEFLLMSFNQKKLIFNAFISSQFNYCPLIWLYHSRSLNNRINRIHEHALRIVFSDYISSFDELINKSGSVRIHHRNLQFQAIKIYKALHNLSPSLMSELFQSKEVKYNLRQGKTLICNKCKNGTLWHRNHLISGTENMAADPWLNKKYSVLEYV